MAVIEAYVTNLGKYNEGELASALLKFPTTREAVQEVLKQIGIDNIRYEEIFIADYDGDLSELNACLGEYESIDELNHLACLLSELDKSDLEKFEAVVASGEHTSGAGDLINLAENLDCYSYDPQMYSMASYARYLFRELEISISACPMMKPWAAFMRRTWK